VTNRLTSSVLRVGVWFLTFLVVVVGLVATLAPRAFYDHVPWVNLMPPYSEHLMRDYGAMNLALALVFIVAATTMERRLVRLALVAYLLFAIPHLIFHVMHLENFTTVAAVAQTTLLTLAVLLPLALLILTRQRRDDRD
jgi:Ca2+/Na+ antiporter